MPDTAKDAMRRFYEEQASLAQSGQPLYNRTGRMAPSGMQQLMAMEQANRAKQGLASLDDVTGRQAYNRLLGEGLSNMAGYRANMPQAYLDAVPMAEDLRRVAPGGDVSNFVPVMRRHFRK